MAEAAGGVKIAISGKVSGIPSTNTKSLLLTSDPTLIVTPAKVWAVFLDVGQILIMMDDLFHG